MISLSLLFTTFFLGYTEKIENAEFKILSMSFYHLQAQFTISPKNHLHHLHRVKSHAKVVIMTVMS